MKQYFPKPYDLFGRNVKVEWYLPNQAAKNNLKGATLVDTSNLASKSDLTSLKAKQIKKMYTN